MTTLIQLLRDRFHQGLLSALNHPVINVADIEITHATQLQFGDYQCNSAMKLAKSRGLKPRELAEIWCQQIAKNDLIAKLDIAGPGFINITINPHYLEQRLFMLWQDPHLGIPHLNHKQKVVIDFSSPNVAKEMHVGHLRSTIIGDAIARIFEFSGYEVLRLNHIGDWGTAFGMLIAYMKNHNFLRTTQEADLGMLMRWYREAKRCFDEDEQFKKQAQEQVVALQQGDQKALQVWQCIRAISLQAYDEIYALLDIHITERGESFYNPMLAEIIAKLTKQGLVTVSEGAKCIFLPGFVSREGTPQPLIIQKSDGGFNYATTDLAALYHRVQVEKADRIIYLTDSGQASHFAMLFKAAALAGFVDPTQVRLDHVPFGLVLGPDGKKFKTRSGDTERLKDLLDEAIIKAELIFKARGETEALHEKAQILGINAIKYADLSCQREQDYQFSYERMLKFEGNTAAFVMYAYVRTQSILRKLAKPIVAEVPMLKEQSEIALGLKLAQFDEVILTVVDTLYPHRLTDYLYTLAESFNAFFRDCRVEGSEFEASRSLLTALTGKVLSAGLKLLGLRILEKM